MSNVLEELVQKVAYMFYQKEKTMVLIGLLEIGDQVNLEKLSNILKFKKQDLAKTLAVLKNDRLIRVDQIEDKEGVEDYDSLTKAQKRLLLKDYYSIDFKSFVDSVNLKIRICRDILKKQCGPEDNIFYKCPKCEKTYSFIDIVSMTDTDEGLFCPTCKEVLQELNDSDEKNRKRKMYEDFKQRTDPLLELIDKTKGKVMIDDPQNLCKSDQLIPLQEYQDNRSRIIKDNQIKRMSKSGSSGPSLQNSLGKRESFSVNIHNEKSSNYQNEDDEKVNKIIKYIGMQEKVPEKSNEDQMKPKSINLFGKDYTADQINDDLIERVANECPDRLEEVMTFAEEN